MKKKFTIKKGDIFGHKRLYFLPEIPVVDYLKQIEDGINACFDPEGVVQSGRVIALRATDRDRLASAFKAGIYLGKYSDLTNTKRFLNKMVKAGHSYEPIRGESVLFLFIGVGKPVYDHLVTYSVGRTTRIAGGQRANLPWGYEVPVEAKNPEIYVEMNLPRIQEVVQYVQKAEDNPNPEQIQAMRSSLPVGYIMPPFLMEFSEEALIKNVFRQRLFDSGAQGATVEVVNDMLQCVLKLDREKWETLIDYHAHNSQWQKAMRTLRDKEYTFRDLCQLLGIDDSSADGVMHFLEEGVYEALMDTVGKMPPSMWDKVK